MIKFLFYLNSFVKKITIFEQNSYIKKKKKSVVLPAGNKQIYLKQNMIVYEDPCRLSLKG